MREVIMIVIVIIMSRNAFISRLGLESLSKSSPLNNNTKKGQARPGTVERGKESRHLDFNGGCKSCQDGGQSGPLPSTWLLDLL